MQANILAFALGVALLQQQAALPEISWAWALLPSALFACILWRYQIPILTVAGKILFVVTFFGAGFFWAAAFAQWRLADALPYEWEGRDIQLVGVVAELPQANEHSLRFAFDVEQVLTEGAIVPARISLAWYKEREEYASIAMLPQINAGERWQVTTRLKRPHGSSPSRFRCREVGAGA